MKTKLIDNGLKTIGVVLDNLLGGYARLCWEAVVDNCSQRGINVVILTGESLVERKPYDYQNNLIYNFISEQHLDGLFLLSATLTSDETTDKIDNVLLKDIHIPSVSISLPYDKATATIMCDNAGGIAQSIEHLIEVHGSKRIAFVKGMVGHKDAFERFESYKQSLERYNIPYDEAIVAQGDFYLPSGREAVRELIDVRKVTFDAVVASNDEMAIGVIEALEERGFDVPGDVRVVGFDNMMEVQFNMSPLATIEQPIRSMSNLAIDLLDRRMRGEEINKSYRVDTKYIPRASCGCLTGSLSMIKSYELELHDAEDIVNRHKQIMMSFIQQSQFSELKLWHEYEFIISELASKEVTRDICNNLLVRFDALHESRKMKQNKVEFWQELLGYSRDYVLSHKHEPSSIEWIETFFIQSRNRIYELRLSVEGFERLQNEENVERLMSELVHELILTESLDELMDRLKDVLPKLKVSSCYVCLYNEFFNSKVITNKEMPKLPKQSKVVMAYSNNQVYNNDEEVFDTIDMLPERYTQVEDVKVLVVHALYFRQEAYGYIIHELGMRNGGAYEAITRQLCSAIAMLRMIQQERQTNMVLENTVETLKATQKQLIQSEKMVALGTLVAGMAHEINTPVGVAVSASSLLERRSKELLAAYETGKIRKSTFEKYLDTNIETSKIVLANLQKAAELIKSFKNVSADQTSEEKRRFYVKEYIWQILVSLRPELKKTFVNVIVNADDGLEIYSYPGAFSQILSNLVLNAIYHAFDKDQEGTIIITVKELDGTLSLIVEDDGKGMPAAVVEKIFNPFFTTARGKGGTGLGMHVVYNIVSQTFDGTIECESEEGIGSKFTINYALTIDENHES